MTSMECWLVRLPGSPIPPYNGCECLAFLPGDHGHFAEFLHRRPTSHYEHNQLLEMLMALKFRRVNTMKSKGYVGLIFGALILGMFCAVNAQAQDDNYNPPFPRLATSQGGTAKPYSADRLEMMARFNWAFTAAWRQMTTLDGYNIATLPTHLKSLSGEFKVFMYANPMQTFHSEPLWEFVKNKISSERSIVVPGRPTRDWWLRDADGTIKVSTWSSALWRINHTSSITPDSNGLIYPQWYARYIDAAPTDVGDWVSRQGRGYKEGEWDGIFVDDVYLSKWFGVSADYNNDGINDDRESAFVRELVMDGHIAFVNELRRLHPNRLVIANLSNMTDPAEHPLPARMRGIYDGGMIESLTRSEAWGGWETMMSVYRRGIEYTRGPKIVAFHHDIGITRQRYPNLPESAWSDERWNRYFLASCLMDDGYYMPEVDASTARWFDEFDIDLGHPIDSPQVLAWSQGVFRREFENGLVLVNPKGNGTRIVNVGEGWKRFLGKEDPMHNDGQIVNSVTLDAQDGIILVRYTSVSRPKPPSADVN